MLFTASQGEAVRFVRTPPDNSLEVDVRTGPAASFAGIRRVLAALHDAGARFPENRARNDVAWPVLFTGLGGAGSPPLAGAALSASERRLHRESEQTFRVLALAASAVCEGLTELRRPLLLHGVAGTDLATLRGLIRTAEYARTAGTCELLCHAELTGEPVISPEADYTEERMRCLRLIGFDHASAELPVAAHPAAVTGTDRESLLFLAALDGESSVVDRLVAALSYCRNAFYTSNWEGMAIVAGACLPLAEQLHERQVADLVAVTEGDDGDHQAIEFEPATIRLPGDVRGFLLKVLGVQATFRDRQDDAIRFFRAIRETDLPLSPEIRSQARLYAALTLTKRKHLLDDAVAELSAGFAELPERSESASIRRERGWLHNLRALTLFSSKDLKGALDHEKRALSCIDGLADASSVHLRVNLVSNISVLQERAGRYAAALRTWRRFLDTDATPDEKFAKHHLYRSGGLRLLAGEVPTGLSELSESLVHCVRLGDDFHLCEIAAELGTALLEQGEPAEAEQHFTCAEEAARRLGDPYRIALTSAGRAASTGRGVGEDTLTIARASRTHAAQAGALVGAVTGPEPHERVLALLPRPRTKLNRPFDLVNF